MNEPAGCIDPCGQSRSARTRRCTERLCEALSVQCGQRGPFGNRRGDRVEVLEQPNPDFAFTRLVELITHHNATRVEWQQMKDMRGLALDWQRRAAEVLARQPKLHDLQPTG